MLGECCQGAIFCGLLIAWGVSFQVKRLLGYRDNTQGGSVVSEAKQPLGTRRCRLKSVIHYFSRMPSLRFDENVMPFVKSSFWKQSGPHLKQLSGLDYPTQRLIQYFSLGLSLGNAFPSRLLASVVCHPHLYSGISSGNQVYPSSHHNRTFLSFSYQKFSSQETPISIREKLLPHKQWEGQRFYCYCVMF